MFETEITVIRPLRVSDGQGGYIEGINPGQASRVGWAMVDVHQSEIALRVDAGEDVKVGDVIGINVEL